MDEQCRNVRNARESRSPRFQDGEVSYRALLRRVGGDDWLGLVQYCQDRHRQRSRAVREARYEDIGLGVAMIYEITDDEGAYDRFSDDYERAHGREPKPDRLHREVFLLLYSENRKDLAGTDATAMREAIKRRVPAERVPRYINEKGGIQRLLEAERERKRKRRKHRWIAVELRVYTAALARLKALEPGGGAVVRVKRSRRPDTTDHEFAIISVR